MDKLQDMIERVFRDIDHSPSHQPLDDAAVRREKEFAEGTQKLNALRAARLAKAKPAVR